MSRAGLTLGRYRTSGTRRRYRTSNKRRGKSTLKKARSRGYGFAYGYIRTKPKKNNKNTYASVSNEYFRYGKYR